MKKPRAQARGFCLVSEAQPEFKLRLTPRDHGNFKVKPARTTSTKSGLWCLAKLPSLKVFELMRFCPPKA
jgi:hypothetical protein